MGRRRQRSRSINSISPDSFFVLFRDLFIRSRDCVLFSSLKIHKEWNDREYYTSLIQTRMEGSFFSLSNMIHTLKII